MAVAIVIVVLVLVVAGVVLARRGAAAASGKVSARLAALDVQRQGKAALDGSRGVLALTPTELVFVRFVPDEEVRWPRTGLGATVEDGALVFADGDEQRRLTVDDPAAWHSALSG